MTTCATPSTNPGITLVGEIVHLDPGSVQPDGVSNLSVRWVGVSVQPPADGADTSQPYPAPLPHGLRGIAEGIRRLIDGPQGRHRRPRSSSR